MANNNHPITPSPKLINQWLGECFGTARTAEARYYELGLATQAARWGYFQAILELKAFLEKGIDGSPVTELAQEIVEQETARLL